MSQQHSIPAAGVKGKKGQLPMGAIAIGPKPFASSTQKVMRLVSSGDVSLDTVARNIETDPALAAKMLRLANSTLYKRSTHCESVNAAVTRVGATAIYEMVAAIAVSKMYLSQTPTMQAMRLHSVGTAAICRFLAGELQNADLNRAYLCGLLHDIGKFLCNQGGVLVYDRIPPEQVRPGRVHFWERKHLGYDHAKVAWHALGLWQVAEPIPSVIAWHHSPNKAYRAGGELATLTTILCAADRLDYYVDQLEEMDRALARDLASLIPFKRLNLTHDWLVGQWSVIRSVKQEALEFVES